MSERLKVKSYEDLIKYRPAVEPFSIDLTRHTIDIDAAMTEEEALLSTAKDDYGGGVSGGKIEGEYKNYLQILLKRHEAKVRKVDDNEEMIVIDSIDGAEHMKSKDKVTSLIGYSSRMYSPSMIKNEIVTAGSSTKFFTW